MKSKQKIQVIIFDEADTDEIKKIIRSFGVNLIDEYPQEYDTYWDMAMPPKGMDKALFTKIRRKFKYRSVLSHLLARKWKVGPKLNPFLFKSASIYINHQQVDWNEMFPILDTFGIHYWTDEETLIALSDKPINKKMVYEDVMGFSPEDYEAEG